MTGRNLRSNKPDKFFKLDDRGQPMEADDFPDYSNITDPTELADAYREYARKLHDGIKIDRKAHADETKDNTNVIKVQERDIKELEKELKIVKEQLENTKALLQEKNEEEEMELQAKDIIVGIPVFSGDPKQLETFLNTCGVYYNMVTVAQKPDTLKIIKAKITGEALSKAGPLGDDLNTWDLLKKRLKERIKKPISLEYANEDLSKTFQKRDESMEDFGARMKEKLKRLNEASRTLASTAAEIEVLRKANEKQAIAKFEQNIRNPTIRVLVSAAGKKSIDECITYAMQKELTEKNNRSCNICGMSNHDESSCRRKGGNNNDKKKFGQKFEKKDNNWRRQYNNPQNDSGSSHEKSEKSHNDDGKRPFNKYSQSKNYSDNWKNRNRNDDNQKSVKTLQQDSDEEEMNIEDAIKMADESKN